MRSHLWVSDVCEIKPGTGRLPARAEALHEPQSAAGAEEVGVVRRCAIGYRFCGSFVEVGEFVGDCFHLRYV